MSHSHFRHDMPPLKLSDPTHIGEAFDCHDNALHPSSLPGYIQWKPSPTTDLLDPLKFALSFQLISFGIGASVRYYMIPPPPFHHQVLWKRRLRAQQ